VLSRFWCPFLGASAILLSSALYPESSQAQVIIPGSCRGDSCWESMLFSKRLIRQNITSKIFDVQTKFRSWDTNTDGSNRPSISKVPFDSQVIYQYVNCSTVKPAVIYRVGNGYTAHMLNPGGENIYGFNRDSYHLYWVVCHSLINPLSPATIQRAAKIGYSGKLSDDQINLKSPFDLITDSSSLKNTSAIGPSTHPGLGPAFTTSGLDNSMRTTKKYHQAILDSIRAGKNGLGQDVVQMRVLSYEPGSTKGFIFWLSVNCSTRQWKFLENDAKLMGGGVEMFGVIKGNEMGTWACGRFGLRY
jgi:hypothetical protein